MAEKKLKERLDESNGEMTQYEEKGGSSSDSSGTDGAYNSALASGSSGSNTPSSNTRTDYDDLRDQNYKNLLDNQIQLEAARQSAMKASKSQLASQGLYGTGYGSTAQTGISNAYLNAMSSANQSYNETDADISAKEREAAATDENTRFTTLTSLLGNATSIEDLESVLEEYGITRNDDGTFSGDYYDSLDDDSKKQFATTYRLLENNINGGGSSSAVRKALGTSATGYDYDSLGNLVAGTNDDMTLSAEYSYEYSRLKKMIESGDLDENGTMIELKRGNDKGEGPRYIYYYKGKFYVTSSDRYGSYSGKRYTITNHSSTDTTSGKGANG